MSKKITFEESVFSKVDSKDITRLADKVKRKKGEVGKVGMLTDNVFFRIVRRGFIIF